MNYSKLAKELRKLLEHIINSSANEDELMFRIAGFYGQFQQIAKENEFGAYKVTTKTN